MWLACVLVALNAFFWIAQAGFALGGGALLQQFFGTKMIRAEVVVQNPDGSTTDERIDRGVIVAVTPALITLKEADGTIAAIPLDPNAQVQGGARLGSVSKLRPHLRVVVFHQANSPAEAIVVEGFGG
jgi:hypothetical protein